MRIKVLKSRGTIWYWPKVFIVFAMTILAAANCTLSDVAQTTVYLADIDDLDAMNEVYARRFPSPAPARAIVAVSGIPMGALIEIDCVGCR